MESSPSLRATQAQGTPLLPISPERINQRHPASPSRSSDLSQLQQSPTKGSGVQSKVAFLNGLARTNSPGPAHHSATTSAALQRAILGREEAESALEGAVSQLSEARTRERKISERVESLLEELQSAKTYQTRERAVYEKEVRKARKEAFRAGSAIVKVQEELKSSREEAKGLKDELLAEREEKEKAKQEAFEHEYKLAGLTEEVTALKEKLRSLEANNHSDELQAKAKKLNKKAKRTVGDVFAGHWEEPMSPELREAVRVEMYSGLTPGREPPGGRNRKSPSLRTQARKKYGPRENPPGTSEFSALNEAVDPEDIDEDYVEDLKDEIRDHIKWLKERDDTIHFMKMQCQFHLCPCRLAEDRGERFVHDVEYDNMLEEKKRKKRERGEDFDENDHATLFTPQPRKALKVMERDGTLRDPTPEKGQDDKLEIAFSPSTGTFQTVPSPAKESLSHQAPQESGSGGDEDAAAYRQSPTPRRAPRPQQHRPESAMEGVRPSRSFQTTRTNTQRPQPRRPKSAMEDVQPSRSLQTTRTTSQRPQSRAAANPNPTRPKTPSNAPRRGINMSRNQDQHPPQNRSNNFQNSTSSAITDTTTTTTTVPLRSENHSSVNNLHATIPGTPVTRQEALAQIKARRGRTRSNANLNRSASACEMNSRPPSRARAVTPVRNGRRTPAPATASDQGDRVRGNKSTLTERRHISAPVGRY
ncbi:hypothetical protein FQN54_001103 [Arachnomyces sp. PD_36]|nr:hypothetical protein FQN54_001103 [Arachnomyces sp. PD_36]